MAERGAATEAERLGRALHLRRVELGLKRPELARRADLSYPYVSEIENGLKTPSTKALRQLAGAVDLSPAELITLADRLKDSDEPVAGSVLVEPTAGDHLILRGHEAHGERVGVGPAAGTSSPSRDSGEVLDRQIETLIAAIVRAELAAWARTELPTRVRAELERALRESRR